MKDLVRNASDEEQVKEAADAEKRARRRELEDVKFILTHPQGRRFIWRYLALCDRTSADNSGSWTYFKEGERNIANMIKADVIQADPQALLKMMMENSKERDNV
jgi:hypothetical protein